MVLKLSPQENPQRTEKKFKKNKIQNQKWFKNVILNHFWFNKEPFWFSFLEPFQEV